MPLRIWLEIFFIGLACGITVILLVVRFVRALKHGSVGGSFRSVVALLLLIGLGLLTAAMVLSCFNPFGGGAVCSGPRDKKSVALTFDDGPNEPHTSAILDILKKNQVKATFFLVGQNVERYPAAVGRILRDGHAIGNHTYSHRSLLFADGATARREIEQWEGSVASFGPPSLRLFRAPHGWKNPLVLRAIAGKGYRLIGWSRGVWDSDRPGREVIFRRATSHLKNGEIILLHDGGGTQSGVDRNQTVMVLPSIIRYCRDRGFEFVTVPEMLGAGR